VGVGHFVLFLDDPDDPSLEELGRLSDVTCVVCDEAYWRDAGGRPPSLPERQKVNNRRGVQHCRRLGFVWTALIDGDELLYSEASLFEDLGRRDGSAPAVLLRPLEAVHDPGSIHGTWFAPTHFKVLPNRWNKGLYRLGFWRSRKLSNYGFFGHLVGKYIVRTDAEVVEYGVHRPVLPGGAQAVVSTRIAVLHYDCMTFDAWQTKWERRIAGDTLVPQMRRERHAQQEVFRETFAPGGEDRLRALYASQFLHSAASLWTLRLLGVVRRIELEWIE